MDDECRFCGLEVYDFALCVECDGCASCCDCEVEE